MTITKSLEIMQQMSAKSIHELILPNTTRTKNKICVYSVYYEVTS